MKITLKYMTDIGFIRTVDVNLDKLLEIQYTFSDGTSFAVNHDDEDSMLKVRLLSTTQLNIIPQAANLIGINPRK